MRILQRQHEAQAVLDLASDAIRGDRFDRFRRALTETKGRSWSSTWRTGDAEVVEWLEGWSEVLLLG